MPATATPTAAPEAASSPSLSTLADLVAGAAATVVRVEGDDRVRRRLLEMGLTTGTTVRLVRRAPLGDPLLFLVRGYQLSLRRSQAALVTVSVPPDEEASSAPADEPPVERGVEAVAPPRTVALAGNPNSGKTTVFNALTGLRQKVANYPGVTVEKRSGTCTLAEGHVAELLDLPGTYSLSPQAPDERVAVGVLRGEMPDTPRPDAVLLVVDAANLARNLLLFSQIADLDLPVVIALSMVDVAARDGRTPDADALERLLGVPVVPVEAHRGRGLDALRAALVRPRRPPARPWSSPAALDAERERLAGVLDEVLGPDPAHPVSAERLLCAADPVVRYAACRDERLVVGVHQGLDRLREAGVDPVVADVEERYRWIGAVVARCVAGEPRPAGRSLGERVDAVLTHRLAGLTVFGAVMGALFVTLFWLAAPLMDAFEGGVGAIGAWVGSLLGPGPLRDLVVDGVFAGVGAVVVFVPQIALLFLFLALLEDSGYLARAAFLMDRLLCKVGLHGKSFIPLLSSHACAIPGIMAARTIEQRRDRLATILVAPFMACSARLPVYALLIGTFFAAYGATVQGLVLLGLYALGIVAAALTAWLAGATVLREPPAAFILELPTYKWPRPVQVLRTMWRNSWLFVRKAGTVILAFSILLWAGLTYPHLDEERKAAIAAEHGAEVAAVEGAIAAGSEDPAAMAVADAWQGAQTAGSYAGRLGHAIEPAIAPLGYDWKIGVGLIGAFAAREVFVSTLAIAHSVGEVEEDAGDGPLAAAIRADTRPDGTPLWTMPVALGLLAFFALAMQCISTVAVVRSETGGWRWPILQLVWMSGLAWLVAFAIYQIGSRL